VSVLGALAACFVGPYVVRCMTRVWVLQRENREVGCAEFHKETCHPAPAHFAYCVVQFAYGTYAEFKTSPASVKDKVSPEALNKLKKLTVVHLAGKQKVLRYADLMSVLDVKTTRELEDLLIDSIFAGMHTHPPALHLRRHAHPRTPSFLLALIYATFLSEQRPCALACGGE